MSTAAPPAAQPSRPAPVAGDSCPLCAAPLEGEQDWCLHCGAAARTRLAATPAWRGPLVALAVLVVLALGALAGALVKLASDSGPAPAPITRTVTTPATGALNGSSSTPSFTAPRSSATTVGGITITPAPNGTTLTTRAGRRRPRGPTTSR